MASKRGLIEASSSDDSSSSSNSLHYPPPKRADRREEFSAVKLLGEQEYSTVVAIDFGTTGTGMIFRRKRSDGSWFSQSPDWEELPNLVSGEDLGTKTPSCVLFKPHYELAAFGEKARRMHNKGRDSDNSRIDQSWLFFEHYKMNLHCIDEQRVNFDTLEIAAANKERMLFRAVIIGVLKYLKEVALECLAMSEEDSTLEVKWVITVPAIWNDAGKSMMRECAVLAGMGADDNLPSIILEPEAAAMDVTAQWIDDGNPLNIGDRYMIVDCGGGTIDIVTHEWLGPFEVCEVIAPDGGPWGSRCIDAGMETLFTYIFGTDIMNRVKYKSPSVWSLLMRECIKAKEMFHKRSEDSNKESESDSDDDESDEEEEPMHLITFPEPFVNLLSQRTIRRTVRAFKKWNATVIGCGQLSLGISEEWMRLVFDRPISELISFLKTMIEDNREVLLEGRKQLKRICLVGGFAESMYLERRVREAVNDIDGMESVRVCVGVNPSNSVLNGAAKIEDIRRFMKQRVLKCTYGYCADWLLEEVREWGLRLRVPKERIYKDENEMQFVKSCFIPIAKKGELVEPGHIVEEQPMLKAIQKDGKIECCVYKSDTQMGPHLLPMDENELKKCRLEGEFTDEPWPEWFDFEDGCFQYIYEIGNEIELQMKIKFVSGDHELIRDVHFFRIR